MQKEVIIVKPLINFQITFVTWQIINDTLNRKKSKDFPQEFILGNDKIISDYKQIANAFNKFFHQHWRARMPK